MQADLDDGHRTELELHRALGDSASLGRVRRMVSIGGYLVTGDWTVPPYLKLIDLESGEIVDEAGRHGEGPSELAQITGMWREEGEGRIGVYDFPNQRRSLWRVDRDSGELEFSRVVSFDPKVPVVELVPLSDGRQYAANGLYTRHTVTLLDSAGGEKAKLVTPLPFGPDDFESPRVLRERNLRMIDRHPERPRIAVGFVHDNLVQILVSPDGPYLSTSGPREITKNFEVQAGEIEMQRGDEQAYIDVAATGSHVYALLCDCAYDPDADEGGGYAHLARRVHVFDWDGSYEGELTLDQEVQAVEVSAGDSLMWGSYADPLPRIAEWELPAWTRGEGG